MGEETQPIAGLHRDIEELPHAELLTVLHENHDEQHLWDCIVAFEGYPFQTISGLPFSYQLKTGRNGELTKELWIDRRENSKSLACADKRHPPSHSVVLYKFDIKPISNTNRLAKAKMVIILRLIKINY